MTMGAVLAGGFILTCFKRMIRNDVDIHGIIPPTLTLIKWDRNIKFSELR